MSSTKKSLPSTTTLNSTCQCVSLAMLPLSPSTAHSLVFPPHRADRSSAFSNASKLILIASKMMTSVYALKPNIALASRQAAVPELHLQLENWYHDLASPLRASTNVVSKAPHPLVIG